MATTALRETIDAALMHEEETRQLRGRLDAELPQLRHKLVLPETDALDSLMSFIKNYVGSVPGCLALVTAVSKKLDFHDYAAPFLNMAEDYFLQPPEELRAEGGLEALLDEAFLAHRLLEEVNDHHIRHLQRPLLPVEMTEANIIVHHLIGDELATRLEHLVELAASNLLDKEHVWDRVRSLPGTEEGPLPVVSTDDLNPSDCRIRLRLAS
jgi:hypothetical protein